MWHRDHSPSHEQCLERKKKQVIALGRLGWSLRRIERAAHIRRETAGAYLRAAGVAVRPPGGWGRHPSKPAMKEVSTNWEAENPPRQPRRSPSASACEPLPGDHRGRTGEGPRRDGHLAGLGGRPRFRGALCQRQALREKTVRVLRARSPR